MTYFVKDNISSVLGAIQSLTKSVEQYRDISDFEKLAFIINDHPNVRPYITSPVFEVVYNMYREDSRWLQVLDWLFRMNVPMVRKNNSLPMSFKSALDNEKRVLELYVKYNYDINERFLYDSYISIYNCLDVDSDLVPLIFRGGWRPVASNSPTDLPLIILRQQLGLPEIKEVLEYYFTDSNPNIANIEDKMDPMKKSNLLTYLARRWKNQDGRILLSILEDPRWSYDSVRYAIIVNSDLYGLLGEELDRHDNRPQLFGNHMDPHEYIVTHRDRCQAGYRYLMNIILESPMKKMNSQEMYAWIDDEWTDCISDYLPKWADRGILYNQAFSQRYLKGLLEYTDFTGNVDLPLNVHQSLCIQMNAIAYFHDHYWFPEWRLRRLYEQVFNN
jgi:hypothetical protein